MKAFLFFLFLSSSFAFDQVGILLRLTFSSSFLTLLYRNQRLPSSVQEFPARQRPILSKKRDNNCPLLTFNQQSMSLKKSLPLFFHFFPLSSAVKHSSQGPGWGKGKRHGFYFSIKFVFPNRSPRLIRHPY